MQDKKNKKKKHTFSFRQGTYNYEFLILNIVYIKNFVAHNIIQTLCKFLDQNF